MPSFTSPVLFTIWGFYCDICDCHILPARAWTPALMSASTHALSRKVLSLTKQKDKIYKTKNDNIKTSFRNYITFVNTWFVISSWTPLKPQHSNPNPNRLANQLLCIDFLTPPTPLIIPHRLPAFLQFLCHSKAGARFMQDGRKAVWSIPFFSKLKAEFYCISFF